MKHALKFCNDQFTLDVVEELFEAGWELDPRYDSKPIRLDSALVFPLVLYESEEERPVLVEEAKKGEFDDVEAVADVGHGDVEAKVKEGYIVHALYQKNVIMVKRKAKEAK